MDILNDMGMSKWSAKGFWKVNYSFNTPKMDLTALHLSSALIWVGILGIYLLEILNGSIQMSLCLFNGCHISVNKADPTELSSFLKQLQGPFTLTEGLLRPSLPLVHPIQHTTCTKMSFIMKSIHNVTYSTLLTLLVHAIIIRIARL